VKNEGIVQRRSFGGWVVSALVLGACAAALAVVSAGMAGSVPPPTYEVFLQPQLLTASGQGVVWSKFSTASGPGTGSATHVVSKIDVPIALLNPTTTSSNCTGPVVVTIGQEQYNEFTCDEGVIQAGDTVKRFVTFTAPSTLNTYTATGRVTFDNGQGGGGGGVNTIEAQSSPSLRQTTVVPGADTRRAGDCFSGGTGTVATQPVSSVDPVQTVVTLGSADPSLGLPCTWGYVSEDDVPGFLTQISSVSTPQFAAGVTATVVVTWADLPVAFKNFKVLLLPNYPVSLESEVLLACVGGQPPAGKIACLDGLVKLGKGARATIRQFGTGGDPGYGGG
jgi:hypothetical protein